MLKGCYFDVVKTLTIRGLPDEVHARLKRQAVANRRSLNQEVIAELCDETVRKADFKDEIFALADEVHEGVSKPLSTEDIKLAMDELRD